MLADADVGTGGEAVADIRRSRDRVRCVGGDRRPSPREPAGGDFHVEAWTVGTSRQRGAGEVDRGSGRRGGGSSEFDFVDEGRSDEGQAGGAAVHGDRDVADRIGDRGLGLDSDCGRDRKRADEDGEFVFHGMVRWDFCVG